MFWGRNHNCLKICKNYVNCSLPLQINLTNALLFNTSKSNMKMEETSIFQFIVIIAHLIGHILWASLWYGIYTWNKINFTNCNHLFISATVNFAIRATMSEGNSLHVAMLDRDGETVDQASKETTGSLKASNFKPWWPWTESKAEYTYMYTLQVGQLYSVLLVLVETI